MHTCEPAVCWAAALQKPTGGSGPRIAVNLGRSIYTKPVERERQRSGSRGSKSAGSQAPLPPPNPANPAPFASAPWGGLSRRYHPAARPGGAVPAAAPVRAAGGSSHGVETAYTVSPVVLPRLPPGEDCRAAGPPDWWPLPCASSAAVRLYAGSQNMLSAGLAAMRPLPRSASPSSHARAIVSKSATDFTPAPLGRKTKKKKKKSLFCR